MQPLGLTFFLPSESLKKLSLGQNDSSSSAASEDRASIKLVPHADPLAPGLVSYIPTSAARSVN